ncbi:glyoxalase superfamily protein [Sulfitobacter sp. 1A13353]|uniref:glyoxalase superfamily protein n=1 Tax=Sulfitobacter sp. 1A13353 TaxID=3368568 RepID=UPI00374591A8
MTTPILRKRAIQSVRKAKKAAARLRDHLAGQGVNLTETESLEAVSHVAGSESWEAFETSLMPPAEDAHSVLLRGVLQLYPGGAEESLSTVWNQLSERVAESQRDAWYSRCVQLTEAVVLAYFQAQDLAERPYDPKLFREAFQIKDEGGFLAYAVIAERDFPDSRETKIMRDFLQTVPGTPGPGWKPGRPLETKFKEQWSRVAWPITRMFDELFSDTAELIEIGRRAL